MGRLTSRRVPEARTKSNQRHLNASERKRASHGHSVGGGTERAQNGGGTWNNSRTINRAGTSAGAGQSVIKGGDRRTTTGLKECQRKIGWSLWTWWELSLRRISTQSTYDEWLGLNGSTESGGRTDGTISRRCSSTPP
jgi:hypothetical protein